LTGLLRALYVGRAARSARCCEPGGGHERGAAGSRGRAVTGGHDYLYQFALLASEKYMSAAVSQVQLFDDAAPPWNAMMAA